MSFKSILIVQINRFQQDAFLFMSLNHVHSLLR